MSPLAFGEFMKLLVEVLYVLYLSFSPVSLAIL